MHNFNFNIYHCRVKIPHSSIAITIKTLATKYIILKSVPRLPASQAPIMCQKKSSRSKPLSCRPHQIPTSVSLITQNCDRWKASFFHFILSNSHFYPSVNRTDDGKKWSQYVDWTAPPPALLPVCGHCVNCIFVSASKETKGFFISYYTYYWPNKREK